MGRNKGKIKSIFIIICFILTVGLLVLAYFLYQQYQDNLENKNKVLAEYKEIMNDQELDEEKIKDINSKIIIALY